MAYFFIFIHSLILTLFSVIIRRRYWGEPLKFFWYPTVILKVLAGLTLGILYVQYYGGRGDTLNYFRDSSLLANYAYTYPIQYLRLIFLDEYYYDIGVFHTGDLWNRPRVFPIVKALSLLNLFTGGSYWIMSFYFSCLSAWGMWRLANTLVKTFPQTYYAAIGAFLIWPSVLIWSSGISKESIAMTAIGFSLAYIIELIRIPQQSIRFWIKAVIVWFISVQLLWLIKFYYLAALLPWIMAFFISVWGFKLLQSRTKSSLFQYFGSQVLGLIGVALLGGLIATQIHPTLSLAYILKAIVYNHNSTYIYSYPEDLIHYRVVTYPGYITLDATLESFIYNTPWALFSALFRPFIWEAWDSKIKLLYSIENTFFFFLTIYALVYAYQHLWKMDKEKQVYTIPLLLVSALFYISILYTILAFASPNFGSLMRYKIAGSPIYIYILLIPWNEQIEQWLAIGRKKMNNLISRIIKREMV